MFQRRIEKPGRERMTDVDQKMQMETETSEKIEAQVWLLNKKRKKQRKPEINTRNSGDERPIEPGKRKCVMGGLWACQCIDGNGKLRHFHLAFFCPSKFLIGKPHPVPYRPRTQF